MKNPSLSIVAPVFNEEAVLGEFYKELSQWIKVANLETEIILVNDGSSDTSFEKMREIRQKDSRVKILNFSRNFGHQVAIKAGIDHSSGDMVVIIDADLQDPPGAILDMIQKCQEGYDVVYAMRIAREGEGFLKKITAALYYRLLNRLSHIDMPLDAGDFRLITRRVANEIKAIHEKRPYVRGLISWVGFRQTSIPVRRSPRFAGETKYSYRKMLCLAWNGITHFSFLPLQLATGVGVITSILCLFLIIQACYVSLVLHSTVPGWTSLMVATLFLGSVQLITLGIIGSYLAKNYDETRPRPLYVIQDKEGL